MIDYIMNFLDDPAEKDLAMKKICRTMYSRITQKNTRKKNIIEMSALNYLHKKEYLKDIYLRRIIYIDMIEK